MKQRKGKQSKYGPWGKPHSPETNPHILARRATLAREQGRLRRKGKVTLPRVLSLGVTRDP